MGTRPTGTVVQYGSCDSRGTAMCVHCRFQLDEEENTVFFVFFRVGSARRRDHRLATRALASLAAYGLVTPWLFLSDLRRGRSSQGGGVHFFCFVAGFPAAVPARSRSSPPVAARISSSVPSTAGRVTRQSAG